METMPGNPSPTEESVLMLKNVQGFTKTQPSVSHAGMRVGAQKDLRTNYDLLSAEEWRKAMEVIERQQPKIVHTAPVRRPWSQMQNIHPNPSGTYQRRRKYLPMVDFCALVVQCRIEHGRYFFIDNPILFFENMLE